MKKTIAVLGSAAALSFSGAGLAAAQDTGDQPVDAPDATTQQENGDNDGDNGGDVDAPETPEEVSDIAQQLCGTISAYDFLGSAAGVAPGLSGEECEANADEAVEAAMSGDISGAIDILRGIDSELGDASGSAEALDSLAGDDAGDDENDADADADATEGDATDGAETENTDNLEAETLTGA